MFYINAVCRFAMIWVQSIFNKDLQIQLFMKMLKKSFSKQGS